MKTFNFKIATMEGVVYSDLVREVTVPTQSGEIGILANHTPIVTLLKPGELKIFKDDHIVSMAVSQGFVEVRRGGEMVILADTADRAEDIDLEAAQAARERAEEALSRKDELSDVDFARFEAIMEREMARIKVGSGRL